MNIRITIELKNSAMIESPETIRSIVETRLDEMIADDPMLGLFFREYTVEVG